MEKCRAVPTNRAAIGAVPAAAVVVVGEDSIVGRALELLLRGSGYDVRFEVLHAFDARRVLRKPGLVLVAPGLDAWDRETVLSSVVPACHNRDLPVLELVPVTASRSRPGEGHTLILWPCKTEYLEREIEVALLKAEGCVGEATTAREEDRT